MIVQISLSGNLFVFRKNPSLQPLQKNVFLSSPSCVFYRSKKAFLKKYHSKKLFSWRKTKLLLSPLDFAPSLFWAKTLVYFSVVLYFFCVCRVISFFFFFCSFFSGVCFSKQKKVKQISFEKIWGFFFQTFSFELFRGRNIFSSKKECVQKLSFEFSSKKKSPLKGKKTYFKIHTRWGSRARMKALLTIAACRAVVERAESMCIQLSLISAAGHPSHQAISLLFFCFSFCSFLRKPYCKKMFCECLSLPFCSFSNFSNTFLTSLLRFFSKIKIFMAEISFFLFSFSCFYSHVSCPFFSPHVFFKVIWWQRTKHVTKRNEWSQWWEWSTRSEKEVFCWRVFEPDRRSELMDLNQPGRMPWLMIFG